MQAVATAVDEVNDKAIHHIPADIRYAKSGEASEIPACDVEHKADDGIDAFGEDISGPVAACHYHEAETPGESAEHYADDAYRQEGQHVEEIAGIEYGDYQLVGGDERHGYRQEHTKSYGYLVADNGRCGPLRVDGPAKSGIIFHPYAGEYHTYISVQ